MLSGSCRRSELFFHRWNHELTAALLSAARARAWARQKFLLPFDGEPLIVHMVRKLSSYSFSFTLSVRPRWRCRFGGIGCNRSKPFTESRFSHDDSNNWLRKLKTDVIVRAGDNANHRRSGDLRHRPGGTEFCQTKLARRLSERSTTLARGLNILE